MSKEIMIGMFAIAAVLGVAGYGLIDAQSSPHLGPENFYKVSDTSICVAGAICTEDAACNEGDIAMGGGIGMALTAQGKADNELLRLDHRLGPMGVPDLQKWVGKINNNSTKNTEMTVSATCLNSTSTG